MDIDIVSDGHGGLMRVPHPADPGDHVMKVSEKVVIVEPKPFQSIRLMYDTTGDGVAQYPQAKTAIRYATQAGFTVFEGKEITADRNDMPGDVFTLQQLRNGKWVWNRR